MDLESFPHVRGPHEKGVHEIERSEFVEWLQHQRDGDRVALYAQCNGNSDIFVHSVFVTSESLNRNWDGLEDWSGNPADHMHCGLISGGGEGPRFEMFSPWDEDQPEVLQGARQIVFSRSFDGHIGKPHYFELTQEIAIAHGLHWVDERSAWCRLDDEGDVVNLVAIEHFLGDDGRAATLLWIDRGLLDLHLAATGSCLIQMFDCFWGADPSYRFDHRRVVTHANTAKTLKCKFIVDRTASYVRGAHVLAPRRNAHELGAIECAKAQAPKEYETFVIDDWKNQRLVNWSCAPSALASYFDTESANPFQISPVFFKPQVLDKYKADREKYKLKDRSIQCRNAWSLETYDVNDAGQVHTYITYLGNLPIAEQRYWKSFDEPPKAPISKRAQKTDFEGSWDDVPDGLSGLKRTLRKLDDARLDWFELKKSTFVDHVTYPLTPAHKPWDDAILELARIVVEGLNHSALRARASANGRAGSEKWGSIRWLEEALLGSQIDSDRASQLVEPLKTLQHLRTKLAAHAAGDEASTIRRGLLKQFKHPRAHIATLASHLDQSLNAICAIFGDDKRP